MMHKCVPYSSCVLSILYFQLTKEQIIQEMMQVTEGVVVDVTVLPSVLDKSKNCGYAIIEYSSYCHAAIARSRLVNNRT
jgi:hypothetical protein